MPNKKTTPKSFEAAIQELEAIAECLEQDNVPLESVISAYERGLTLINYCKERLTVARGKIQKLDGQALINVDDNGE